MSRAIYLTFLLVTGHAITFKKLLTLFGNSKPTGKMFLSKLFIQDWDVNLELEAAVY